MAQSAGGGLAMIDLNDRALLITGGAGRLRARSRVA
jgi:hypothetical protein